MSTHLILTVMMYAALFAIGATLSIAEIPRKHFVVIVLLVGVVVVTASEGGGLS